MSRRYFQLIDLDRTLFDTSRFAKAITDEINRTEPGVGTALDKRYEAAYQKEETFFLLRYLRQEHGDAWFEALVERVLSRFGAAPFILPGVKERLSLADSVTDYRPSWGILTYGDDIDQRMKARIIGLQDVPMLLVDSPDKAKIIATWQTGSGEFQLPSEFGGGLVESVSLEDDKLRAFVGLPKEATGYWIMQDTKDPRQLDEIKADGHVEAVTGLFDISEKIKTSL